MPLEGTTNVQGKAAKRHDATCKASAQALTILSRLLSNWSDAGH
ncbi:hypothetical protein [Streptomyces vilmorinianum]|nr:hypothetical protein [Streptomyces vilmorinianum]